MMTICPGTAKVTSWKPKYMYVCHAELNAILNSAHSDLRGSRVYVTLFPCNECAKGHHSERHPGNHLSFG